MEFQKINALHGELTIPGDKSISHRAVMLGAISSGTTVIKNFLQGADCLSTIACFRQMGISIIEEQQEIRIEGKGLHGLQMPHTTLDVGNSGTTLRLLAGILAGSDFLSTITGDVSIQSRPMKRVMMPLSQMGASISSIMANNCAPLAIKGHPLRGISYASPVASAQVKSCVLLAGLYANDITSVTEPYRSRNHTELMLTHFGAQVCVEGTKVSVHPQPHLIGQEVAVPGDISSAAYFIAAGLLVPNAEILIKNVGINPTRDGILRVCKQMGANITLLHPHNEMGEATADILVKSSDLKGVVLEGALIPTLIDEIPIIALLGACAAGETIIRDAQELKVKESNRIDVMVDNLTAMGVDIRATEDGMIIHGGNPLHGAIIDSKSDHRIAMTFAIAGLLADSATTVLHDACVDISYPGFYEDLKQLIP